MMIFLDLQWLKYAYSVSIEEIIEYFVEINLNSALQCTWADGEPKQNNKWKFFLQQGF